MALLVRVVSLAIKATRVNKANADSLGMSDVRETLATMDRSEEKATMDPPVNVVPMDKLVIPFHILSITK